MLLLPFDFFGATIGIVDALARLHLNSYPIRGAPYEPRNNRPIDSRFLSVSIR